MKGAILKYNFIQKLINKRGVFNDEESAILLDLSLDILVFVRIELNKNEKEKK